MGVCDIAEGTLSIEPGAQDISGGGKKGEKKGGKVGNYRSSEVKKNTNAHSPVTWVEAKPVEQRTEVRKEGRNTN